MKKSLLITLEFPPQVGGVASYYFNVCKNLPPDKIVVMAPTQKETERFDQSQNFPIIREKILNELAKPKLNKLASQLQKFKVLKLLGKIVNSHNIELIQVGNILPLGTLAYLQQKRQQTPYLIYTHGLDILLPQESPRKKILLKKIISQAQTIIANSNFTKNELINLGAEPAKVLVVYPCPSVDNAAISDWKIEELKDDYQLKDKKILLTVGRLVERKGHDMVIKSLPAIIKQVPNVIYLIIGKGPFQKNLENLVSQHSLRDYVKILDNIPNGELPGFYQLSDVFIMPSRQIGPDAEGFGITYLEANLFSKPVIGGKSGGVPEAVIDGRTGILVEPTNEDEIIQAAVKLLTDTAYAQRLGMQGMERVLEQFDWENQTNIIKKVLE